MVDMLKITSPITSKNKVENISKNPPKDIVFDIKAPAQGDKIIEKDIKQGEGKNKQFVLTNLNKEVLETLLSSTKAQTDTLKKLILMINMFEDPSGEIPKEFLSKIFIKPEQLFTELLSRDKNETVFKGDFFDSLRLLMKVPDQPKLKEAIGQILKNFDCFVKKEGTLNAIVVESEKMVLTLPKAEAKVLEQAIRGLKDHVNGSPGQQKEISTHIKNAFLPVLIEVAKSHKGNQKIYNNVMSIVQNIVRLDNADSVILENSIVRFGEELSRLTSLSEEELVGIKKLVFEHAKKVVVDLSPEMVEKSQDRDLGAEDKKDLANLISKTLEKAEPGKITSVAQNLMFHLLQSESPLLPYMHFVVPVKFPEEQTYGEFFIDKECKGRKGESKEARNIFFTIQSDKYGTFEVDLLAKDQGIELDIKGPEPLLSKIKEGKTSIRGIVEEQGYRLMDYQVGIYKDGASILSKFPALARRKAGIDVKI